ncbi:MAG: translation initiation factor IF-2 N-terminal domain-containing protein, partial [Solirubrobacterales bacterium]
MSKKRVHEIAKEQGVPSKALIERLKAAGVEVKTASSSVDEALALRALDGANSSPVAPPAPTPAPPSPAPVPQTSPAQVAAPAAQTAAPAPQSPDPAPQAAAAVGGG